MATSGCGLRCASLGSYFLRWRPPRTKPGAVESSGSRAEEAASAGSDARREAASAGSGAESENEVLRALKDLLVRHSPSLHPGGEDSAIKFLLNRLLVLANEFVYLRRPSRR